MHNDRATIHVRNLSSDVDEDLLFELGVQFGEVVRVTLPTNKLTQQREEFGFIEFASAADAQYMRDVIRASLAPLRLFGKNVTVSYKGDKVNDAADALLDIGARIVVSPVDPKMCDPEGLRRHFSQFGGIAVPPQLTHEPGGSGSEYTATVSFTGFDASDAAIKATNGQFLFGKRVRAEYAMRLDGKGRHGSEEERALYECGGLPASSAGGAGGAMMAANMRQRQSAGRNMMTTTMMPTSADAAATASSSSGQLDWAHNLNPYAQ